ncbi:SIR2 family protein [Azohydromonas lata]|uniref:SIR2 family protein n=1 Tax=Azohydromonas lata TaxID=45677 RepID=A0ABU5IL64_9BURK|nr:SIR2 family protein [Azohydromonas lata]MDZ5459642.1 SIR2 family protein [Azohydromonas lata]
MAKFRWYVQVAKKGVTYRFILGKWFRGQYFGNLLGCEISFLNFGALNLVTHFWTYMDIRQQLIEHLKQFASAPFIFVGSGLSRRYLGLETWERLLRKFCEGIKDFEFYNSLADGDLAQVASLMDEDFHAYWWSSDNYKESRLIHKSKVKQKSDPLRMEICIYLSSLEIKNAADMPLAEEVSLLRNISIDGVITTNWDGMLESLFGDYKVFFGQNELLFSNPQSIAEIYKIHGCASDPSSLVLTKDDYKDFERKNPYLAAKLITLFVEHPIIFLGYSLHDPHIGFLLRNILDALGSDKVYKLQNNLIFVQQAHGASASVIPSFIAIDKSQLPITVVKTDDFSSVYSALQESKRKLPIRILRFFKEQLYDLVRTTEPSAKLFVKYIDQIQSKDDVEFVAGVGVAAEERASEKGYEGFGSIDLFSDLILEDRALKPNLVVNKTIPMLGKNNTYLPIFKYLKAIGASSYEDCKRLGINLDKHYSGDLIFYRNKSYEKSYNRDVLGKSAAEIVDFYSPEKAAIYLAYLEGENFDCALVKKFLVVNFGFIKNKDSKSTQFKKLACFYDYICFGWHSGVASP